MIYACTRRRPIKRLFGLTGSPNTTTNKNLTRLPGSLKFCLSKAPRHEETPSELVSDRILNLNLEKENENSCVFRIATSKTSE